MVEGRLQGACHELTRPCYWSGEGDETAQAAATPPPAVSAPLEV
ncbi:MAG: hypothetical protein ACI8RZ_008123 [Myxococcota bacterium]|jgi:hypothetical protein